MRTTQLAPPHFYRCAIIRMQDEHGCSNPNLDFLSPQFSAEEALVCSPSKIQLPCPEVAPCDNLEQYASLVRGIARIPPTNPPPPPLPLAAPLGLPVSTPAPTAPQDVVVGLQQKEKEVEEEVVVERVRQRSGLTRTQRVIRTIKSVISTMECGETGPLKLLEKCKEEKIRVRVLIRHCAGIRGECLGHILAFDKHFNIVMRDVDEEYSPLRTVNNGGVEPRNTRRRRRRRENSADNTSNTDRGQRLHRHVDKLFIRGDNIVLISIVHTAQSLKLP